MVVVSTKNYEYDVALSYASEDREYVERLAHALQHLGVKVFYDKYEKSTLWGHNLYPYLSDLYQNKARYCVMFLSKQYASKLWTNHELQAAQSRAFKEQNVYILPIRLDDTEVPGILPTIACLYWHQETPEAIADTILSKLDKEALPVPTLSQTSLSSSPQNDTSAVLDLQTTSLILSNSSQETQRDKDVWFYKGNDYYRAGHLCRSSYCL